ncbi:uncharacterized protein LOC135693278 [Rhopilema esculentum]|uniref:uncharacterized protein LOC135693278 n=1 Tax=Rhopilema esculentum TaxID=499914 RepID=UPI0031D1AB82
MASNDSGRSDNSASSSSGEEDYGVVRLQGFAPYQDEPLAIAGQPTFHFEEDKDGIPRAVLAARQEQRIIVEEWCSCGKCKADRLVGALEFRCCTEVAEANGKLTFEGREDISCIIQHEDYTAVTNEAVLTMTGPLLKDKNGRIYKRKAGQSKNQYLRAVAYRWVVRWIFGYLGWDNTRPLPACIYNHIREKYQVAEAIGYASAQERQ